MAVPRLKQNDNNLYPGPEGALREREFTNETNPKDIFTEYCIQLADIDEEVAKLLDTGSLGLTVEGSPVPVVQVDNERWAEFSKTWQLQNGDNNISPPLITIRRTDEQVGTLLGQKWTIPNRKHFTTLKVPTFENGIRGIRHFQMTQPTSVDAIYEIRLIALYKDDTTAMSENFLREYNGRQLYINVKGKYFPTILEDMSKEDTMEEIDADRYYVRIFNIKVQASIQRLEDFREIDLPNRIITLTEMQGEIIAQTSQSIIAPMPEPPSIGVSVGGAEIFGGNNGPRGNGGILDMRFDNVTKTLSLVTVSGDYTVDLHSLMDDITVTDAEFNPVTKVLSIRSSDGNIVQVAIPVAPSVLVTGATFDNTSKELSIQSSDGSTVGTSLASLVPTPESITWTNLVAAIAAKALVPGKDYIITNRPTNTYGGVGNVLTRAISTTELDTNAILFAFTPDYVNTPIWAPVVAGVFSFAKRVTEYTAVLPSSGDAIHATELGGDDNVGVYYPEFPINFGGQDYYSVTIDTNGRVMLGSQNYNPEYVYNSMYVPWHESNPVPGIIPPVIALFWNDLYASSGQIRCFTTGGAGMRKFVVDYTNVYQFTGDNRPLRGQIVFDEADGSITISYGSTVTVLATQGIFYMNAGVVTRDLVCSQTSSVQAVPVLTSTKFTPRISQTVYDGIETIWDGKTWTRNGPGIDQPGTSSDWVPKDGGDVFGNSTPVTNEVKYYVANDLVAERRDALTNVVRGNAIQYFPWGNANLTGNTLNSTALGEGLMTIGSLRDSISVANSGEIPVSQTIHIGDMSGATKMMRVKVAQMTVAEITGINGNLNIIGANGTTSVAIPQNGYLGLGDLNPYQRLTVNGRIGFTQHGSYVAGLGTAGAGLLEWFSYEYYGGEQGFSISNTQGRIYHFNTQGNSYMMGGNVGIGTTNPTAKLQVAGTIHSSMGGYKFPDYSIQLTAGHTGPIAAGLNSATKVLSITPSVGGTTNVDLSSLNPYPGATTLEYFQGFTAEDVVKITNDTNWNIANNGEYTGPALTTSHRAIHEVYASATVPGTLYSTDGTGKVNRYFSN